MNSNPVQPSPWVLATEPTSLGDPAGLVTLAVSSFEMWRAAHRPGIGAVIVALLVVLVGALRPVARDGIDEEAEQRDPVEPQDHPDDFQYPGGPPIPPYDVAGWTLPLQFAISLKLSWPAFPAHSRKPYQPSKTAASE